MCDAKATATGVQAIGTIIGAKGDYDAGNAQAAELQYRAAQERRAANAEIAAGSARIADTDLAGKALESRMMAVASASGVDMASPSVVSLVTQAANVTSYNKAMELFNAQTRSNTMLDQASADEFSAQQDQRAGSTRAFGTILRGVSAIQANYSGGTK